jgi:hypothetical protein
MKKILIAACFPVALSGCATLSPALDSEDFGNAAALCGNQMPTDSPAFGQCMAQQFPDQEQNLKNAQRNGTIGGVAGFLAVEVALNLIVAAAAAGSFR